VDLIIYDSPVHEMRHENHEIQLHCHLIEKLLIPLLYEPDKAPKDLHDDLIGCREVKGASEGIEFSQETVELEVVLLLLLLAHHVAEELLLFIKCFLRS
jgi:hypothetical protein